MNTTKIIENARKIAVLQEALHWLREYGVKLKDGEVGDFKISFAPVRAASCRGSDKAQYQIESIAKWHIEAIIKHAINDAENTLEILRSGIKSEVFAPASGVQVIEGE